MGAVGAAPIFDRLPVETVRLHFELDGTVDYDDRHFNVRPSNTEPLLRLNLEAGTAEEMRRRRDEVLAVIRS